MRKTSALLILALGAAIATTATPAQAIPTLPPPVPDTLTVIAYFSDASRTVLVGQSWSGCGKPSGSWGNTSATFRSVFFPVC